MNSSVERIFKQAWLVLKSDSHVAAKSGHLKVEDFWVTDDFLDIQMVWQFLFDNLLLDDGVTLFV